MRCRKIIHGGGLKLTFHSSLFSFPLNASLPTLDSSRSLSLRSVPTKVEFRYIDGLTKVRVAKTSGAVIPRPDILRQRRKPRECKKDLLASHVGCHVVNMIVFAEM